MNYIRTPPSNAQEKKAKAYKPRFKEFLCELYPESSNIDDLVALCREHGIHVTYILHDRDVWDKNDKGYEIGSLKKPHWHIILETRTPKELDTVRALTGIKHLETPYSLAGAFSYLVHANHPNKYQYPIEDVFSTRDSNVVSYRVELGKKGSEAETPAFDEKQLEAMQVLDDAIALLNNKMTLREFIIAHPAFAYRANALHSLFDLVKLYGEV